MRILICVVVLLESAGSARAVDARKLLGYCKSPQGSEPRIYCLAYINGVAETLSNLADLGGLTGSPCMPEGTTLGQMADVIVGYIASNPKEEDWPAAGTVGVALNKAWPACNKQGK